MTNKLDYETLLTSLEFEHSFGSLFLEYHTVVVDRKSINNFVLSKGYYYEYNCFNTLWVEISKTQLNNRITQWLHSQWMILNREMTDTAKALILTKAVTKCCKYKYIESVVMSITSDILDDSIFDKLDKVKPELLPIKNNRVINLFTKEVRPRVISDYFTFECPVEPVDEYSDFFTNMIESIMCGNKENLDYFQRIMGYCLTGSKEAQSYFIWYGKGSNGKSLILNLLQAVLGKAASPISKSVMVDMGKKGSNGCEMITLKDLRLGTFSETNSNDALNEGILKTISGGDRIRARALYKEEISFELFVKLIVCTNHKPEFNGADHGTTRRIKLLPFDAKFVSKDPNPAKREYPIIEDLENTLIKNHLDEFFTFCLEGAVKWSSDKKFDNVPQVVREQQEEYIREQNSFGCWFKEYIRPNDGYRLNRPEAYKSYACICDERGLKPLSKKDFFNKLGEECGKPYKYQGNFVYMGFTLLEDDSD
jgi:putative DNA primase/helicase